VTIESIDSRGATSLIATITSGASRDEVTLDVDAQGLISGLLLSPAELQPVPSTLPSTPAGAQARWLFGALDELPLPASEIKAHFDSAFLAEVAPATLDTDLEGIGPLRLASIAVSSPAALVAIVETDSSEQLKMSISVDAHGLIAGLLFQPDVTAASSWSQIDRQVRSVAPRVELLVASLRNGTCTPIHSINPTTPGPLGSAFKLYVLDALARAVEAGKVAWNQQLTITSQLKSLPSGVLLDDPDGTKVSVQETAEKMISISDNTAANMLTALLGRPAVQAATRASGMAEPALDVPFLTTRELFVLKLDHWPTLAERYLTLDAPQRLVFLEHDVDPVSFATLEADAEASPWTTPRDVSSIEWFASPQDICRVYASLAGLATRPKLAPLDTILSLNSGSLGLAPSSWRTVWFKGGSEPGVLTLNYLATTVEGKTFVVSVLAENAKAPLPNAATTTLLAAAKGALQLAAG
jgi:hypothetical protein